MLFLLLVCGAESGGRPRKILELSGMVEAAEGDGLLGRDSDPGFANLSQYLSLVDSLSVVFNQQILALNVQPANPV